MWYDFLKGYYDEGFYTNDDMKYFVSAGWITADEYQTITGTPYV